MRKRLLIPLILLLALTTHWLLVQGQERVRGVITRPLGSCDIEWFDKRDSLVLACPHTDLIKLWPLPVEQPWWEHSPFSESVAKSN
jgi:hypothetical protein